MIRKFIQYLISVMVLSSFLFILMSLSGCTSEKRTTVSGKPASGDPSPDRDVTKTEWLSLKAEPRMTEGWEVVQYIPDLATPSDEECALATFHTVSDKERLYSLLYLYEESETGQLLKYELKCLNCQNMEISILWSSLSDIGFDQFWSKDTVEKMDNMLLTGKAAIITVDTVEDGYVLFMSACDDEKTIEHLYGIRIDHAGDVQGITDYIEYFPHKNLAESYIIAPEMVCAEDGSIILVDYDEKKIFKIDKNGKLLYSLDARGFLSSIRCIGKTAEGMPVFSCIPSVGRAEFFCFDATGRQILYSGEMTGSVFALDKQGNVLILDGSSLLSWDISTGNRFLMYSFTGLLDYMCMGLNRTESGEVVICFLDGDEVLLYRLNDYDHPEIKELVLLQDFQNPYIENCAADYTRTHPDVRIKVEQLESNDEFNWNKILNRIKDGSGPDLIWTNRKQLDKLRNAGAICSIDGLISEEILDNIFKGALKIGEFDSELYALPSEAGLEVVMVNEEYWDKPAWTIEEFISQYTQWENSGEGRVFSTNTGMPPLSLFKTLCVNNVEASGFVDLNAKECFFETDRFYNLLRFCKEYGDIDAGYYISNDDRIKETVSGTAFSCLMEGSLINYSDIRKKMGDSYHAVGVPTDMRISSTIACYRAMAINAMSDNKEAAAGFLEALTCEKYQSKYTTYWVRKDVLSDHVINAWEWHTHTMNGPEPQEKPAFEINKRVHVPLSGREDGTSYVDEYIKLMDEGIPLSNEYEIQEILIEEVSAYFAGAKTEQEVAGIIQNRVQLYLDERSGGQ